MGVIYVFGNIDELAVIFSKTHLGHDLYPTTSTKTTSGSTTASSSILPKTYMTHVLYPIFQEKSIENCLRYVRGLHAMPIDVDNVNQAEPFKWVCHIFQNTHGTCFIFNFSREISGNGLKYVRGLLVMLINVDNIKKAESHKWVRRIFKNPHRTCFISYSSRHALEKFLEKLIENGLRYVMSESSTSC